MSFATGERVEIRRRKNRVPVAAVVEGFEQIEEIGQPPVFALRLFVGREVFTFDSYDAHDWLGGSKKARNLYGTCRIVTPETSA